MFTNFSFLNFKRSDEFNNLEQALVLALILIQGLDLMYSKTLVAVCVSLLAFQPIILARSTVRGLFDDLTTTYPSIRCEIQKDSLMSHLQLDKLFASIYLISILASLKTKDDIV